MAIVAVPVIRCNGARRTLRTGEALLTDRQRARLEALFDGDDHARRSPGACYQRIVSAYRDPDRAAGRYEDGEL